MLLADNVPLNSSAESWPFSDNRMVLPFTVPLIDRGPSVPDSAEPSTFNVSL